MGSLSLSQKFIVGPKGGIGFLEYDCPGLEPFNQVILAEDILVVRVNIHLVESLQIDMVQIVCQEVEGIGGGEPHGRVVCSLVGELWGHFRVGTVDVRGLLSVVVPESNSHRKVARSIVSGG